MTDSPVTNPVTLRPGELAGYQEWLNAIKQRVVSARMRMALEANRELILFYWELGKGFAFIGRQFHLEIAGNDYYIDLLFYHVTLKCYVMVELKNRKFTPEYAGKLNFYLLAVDSLLKGENDHPCIGLLLCREQNNIEVEFALCDMNKPMGVSEYTLVEALPDDLKGALPTVEGIENDLRQLQRQPTEGANE